MNEDAETNGCRPFEDCRSKSHDGSSKRGMKPVTESALELVQPKIRPQTRQDCRRMKMRRRMDAVVSKIVRANLRMDHEKRDEACN